METKEEIAKRKVAVLGYTGVGKTSICTRFVQGQFEEAYNPTITNTFRTTICNVVRGKHLNTEVLDTAGLDGHMQISRHAAIGVHGYIMVYSTVSRVSFENIKHINDNLIHTLGDLPEVPRVLVGSMCDLTESCQVSPAEGKLLAASWGVPFLECSAKADHNVQEVFHVLINEIEQAQGMLEEEDSSKECLLS